MKKNLIIAFALLAALGNNVFPGGSAEQPSPPPQTPAAAPAGGVVRIATGDYAGTYHSYASYLAPILFRETQIPFSILTTHGSVENLELLKAGNADLAIVQNDIADYAWKEAHFFEDDKNTGFAAVAALYTEACQIVADPASGIRTVQDLRGKRVSIGDYGSGTEVNARQILEVYGIKLEDIQRHNLGFGASVQAMKDHRIDAFFCVAGAPTPAIVELTESKEVIFLEIGDDYLALLMRYDPYYTRYVIPGGTYRGQYAGIKTLALKAALVASWELSDDAVYLLTKSIFETRRELADAHAAGTGLTIDFADFRAGISIPFHPGAARFYKEIDQFPVLPLPKNRPD